MERTENEEAAFSKRAAADRNWKLRKSKDIHKEKIALRKKNAFGAKMERFTAILHNKQNNLHKIAHQSCFLQ